MFMERLTIYKEAVWRAWLGMFVGIWALIGSYDTMTSQVFPDKGLPAVKYIVSWWDWKIWVIGLLVVTLIASLEGNYHMVKKLKSELASKEKLRQELERQLSEKELQLNEATKVKNDLKIGAKVKEIKPYGYYDKATHSEGDKQVFLDVILAPAKPMRIDMVALELWDKRYEAKIQREVAPFDLILLTPVTLTATQTYTATFDVSKELAIDTKEAYIYVLANGLNFFSEPFAINFGRV